MHHAKPENRELVSASLKLLAMRDMSRVQFEQKLARKQFSADDIQTAANWCEAEGWLNEVRYAEALARRLGHKYGATRIAQTLKQKGVVDHIVRHILASSRESEISRANGVWSRKFATPPDSVESRVKQSRYLQARGFDFAVIRQVLAGRDA